MPPGGYPGDVTRSGMVFQSGDLVMVEYLMTQHATLFKGPDMETLSVHRDTHYFERLDQAIRHAVEQLSTERKSGAYIRLESDHHILPWDEIEKLYKDLAASN
jgi:hypothetical protein